MSSVNSKFKNKVITDTITFVGWLAGPVSNDTNAPWVSRWSMTDLQSSLDIINDWIAETIDPIKLNTYTIRAILLSNYIEVKGQLGELSIPL